MKSRVTHAALALTGIGLIVCALAANQNWLDRHFFPSFFLMRRWYTVAESCVRAAIGLSGALVLIVARWRARREGRVTPRRPVSVIAVIVAAALALGASEAVLGWAHRSTEWRLVEAEPLRRPDSRLGWTLVPSRTGQKTIGGRVIEYAFDAAGYRVRRVDEPVDPARPTILFTGESVMAGDGLSWEESIPAQVGAMMGVQSANLAVHGYANDQMHLRLATELPRFQRPVAVVSLFMTAVFGRNLDDDRPHLGPDLMWMPPIEHGRLVSLAKFLVPFRRDATVERGVAETREVLRATVALAHARGATPLIIVPQFNREDETERMLRRRILDEAGLPYVFVEFESGWRLPGDLHPNAATAHAIAVAVADWLREHGFGRMCCTATGPTNFPVHASYDGSLNIDNLHMELLHGALEMLVLRTLMTGPRHGYAIAHAIQDTSRDALTIEFGSLYPALKRLELKGWIAASWETSEQNRRARVYRLTALGRRQLKNQQSEWAAFARGVARVMKPLAGEGES